MGMECCNKTIIGILAVAFLPSILAAPAKARDAQRIETMKKINDFILYHYSVGTSGFSLPGGWYCIQPKTPLSGLNLFINNNVADFGGSFPKDPLTTWNPLYCKQNKIIIYFGAACMKKSKHPRFLKWTFYGIMYLCRIELTIS